MLRPFQPLRTATRFLLALARHLGGPGAVHYISTRAELLTLSEAHTAARLLRSVRMAEAAGLPGEPGDVVSTRGAGGVPTGGSESAPDASLAGHPPAAGGAPAQATEGDTDVVVVQAETQQNARGHLQAVPRKDEPKQWTVEELDQLGTWLYHAFRSGPDRIQALRDELERRRAELEEGIKGYRVLAKRNLKGDPATVEIDGERFEHVQHREPWADPRSQHGPVKRGDIIAVKVSDVDPQGTPRALDAAGKLWVVNPDGFSMVSSPAPESLDLAKEFYAFIDGRDKIETPEDLEEARRILVRVAGVQGHRVLALLGMIEDHLRSPAGAVDFKNHEVRKAVEEHARKSAIATIEQSAAAGLITIHGKAVPAKPLERDYKGVPQYVEIEGEVYARKWGQDAEHIRRQLEKNRITKRLRAMLDEEGRALLTEWFQHQWEHNDRDQLAALKEIGRFLVHQGQRELWKLLYLKLREEDSTTDTLMNVIQRDGYRENDELLFAFGEHWEHFMRDLDEQEQEAERDGEGDVDEEPPPTA